MAISKLSEHKNSYVFPWSLMNITDADAEKLERIFFLTSNMEIEWILKYYYI